MTQLNTIFSFLLKNPNLRPKEIAEKLGIPAPSVRRVLHTLRVKNAVSKPKKDFTVAPIVESLEQWKKYTVNVVMYCSSKPTTKKATTWSNQNFHNSEIVTLMNDMLQEIFLDSVTECSEIHYNSGLDIQNVKSPNEKYIYTDILVGESKIISKRSLESWK